MKLLVLVQDYPSDENPYAMSYVHTRCLGYQKRGHEVDVLNFSSERDYAHQGINVFAEAGCDWRIYDRIISHAPNLKNHVRYLNKVTNAKIAFFFHGHEVLRRSEYPTPYKWNRPSALKRFSASLYDSAKLIVLHSWLRRKCKSNDIGLVFVSEWMRQKFESNIGKIAGEEWISTVIPNAVHDSFVDNSYVPSRVKSADFVTIRPLDDSKYCVDMVVRFAERFPGKKFHIFGRGQFFLHIRQPKNVVWFDRYITQDQIPRVLNQYSYALMPTRFDAQGVMMCEMAVYGIPVVTTKFTVCQEMLAGFDNCACLDLDAPDSMQRIQCLQSATVKNRKFDSDMLVKKEIEFFHAI
ncbi:glycosyltransferase [Variovorax sp.]|uniref:glycosyltransferase n=1 Tax=Variovorax sp. TaxID=1871043 RepID=UPI002D3BC3E5|nr:glycosyltransferase [Variovorax sp.]HYP86218.1 glycosyltransferase [Variovorax sp.]